MDVISKEWYKNWFGNEYLTVYAHRDQTEAFELIDLLQKYIVLRSDAYVLDLCCGQGRHALILAKKGYFVIGADLSRTMLESAKFKTAKHESARFVQADMRHLPLKESFDLVLNLFTSFGYFETDHENRSVFDQFRNVLKKEGRFVFDYLNPDHVIDNLVSCQKERVGNLQIEQERYIEGGRVEKKIRLRRNDRERVFYESVKMYQPQEIFDMMTEASLDIQHVFGDYQGAEFKYDSPRLVIIGSRRT